MTATSVEGNRFILVVGNADAILSPLALDFVSMLDTCMDFGVSSLTELVNVLLTTKGVVPVLITLSCETQVALSLFSNSHSSVLIL